jgi:Glycosyl transferase family 2
MSSLSLPSSASPFQHETARHLLIDAVGSLLNQEYPIDRNEIIVDNGSTDATGSSVMTLAESHPTHAIRFLGQSAANQNAARNTGIKKARGEFIAFTDDDELAPHIGSRAWSLAQSGIPCWGASAVLTASDSRGHPHVDMAVASRRGLVRPGEVESEVQDLAAGNMVFRAEMIEATGPFNEALSRRGDETEWMARHRRAGGMIIYLPSVPVWNRRTKSGLTVRNRIRKAYQIGRERTRFQVSVGRSHSRAPDRASIPRFARARGSPTLFRWFDAGGCLLGLRGGDDMAQDTNRLVSVVMPTTDRVTTALQLAGVEALGGTEQVRSARRHLRQAPFRSSS